jgi:hypothetical protein
VPGPDRFASLIAIVLLLSARGASAQIGSGTLTGIVRDASGAGIPGVSVEVTNVDTNGQRVAISSSGGVYTTASLPPGRYRLDIELSGFKRVTRDGIRVTTGEVARVDVEMALGAVTDRLIVTANAPVLRSETATLGQTVQQERIAQLPLNGRTFITLAALTPGVALPPDSQLPRINGGRPRTNEYLFDGISVLQPEPGQVAYYPILDAIEEFTIESNSVPAEFGRFNGGVVNLTTRAGTNSLHGTGFEFLRNEALNARNYFQPAPAAKPEYRRNQFGGTVGGPIARDRTFFFVDYQGQRQGIGRTVISTVPTALQRQGIFTEAIAGRVPVIYDPSTTVAGTLARTPFPGNAIPAGRMDPVAAALLRRYPLPTSAGTANNFRRTGNERDNQDQWDVRIDQRFSSNRDSAFARMSEFRDHFTPVTPLPDGSGVTAGTLGPQRTLARSFAANYQHAFAAGTMNEVRAGDTRRRVGRDAARLGGSASIALGLPGIPSNAQFPTTLPTFLIGGYQQLGSPPNTASNFDTGVTEVADTLTWVAGRHTWKVGADWRWERLDVIQPPSPTGSFTFNALGSDLPGAANTGSPLASFLLGQVQTFSVDLQQSAIRERAHVAEHFVQDDWKMNDRITLNAGLRYTLNFPSREINGQTAVFNLETQQLDYPGDTPVRPLKKNNLGPRLGVVYRPTGKTIVSSGYGLVWIEMAGITTPFTTPTFPFVQTVSQRALDTISPAFLLRNGPSIAPLAPTATAGLGQGVFAVDRTLGSGYVQQWNVALQRELTRNTVVEIAYVGSNITHVGVPDTNLNQLSASQLALGNALLERVPNPYFGIVARSSSLGDPTIPVAQLLKRYPAYTTVSLYRNNVGNTRYHGVELSARQRLAHGLTYSAAYTRSKLIDDASSVFDASILTGPVANYPVADSFDRGLERDYSTGDIPHAFVSSVVWNFAKNWTVANIVTLQSGAPIPVTQTTNFNAFAGFGVQRPNIVGDPVLPADERTPQHWFNTAAFAVAPQFTIGNASRNPVRGPAYRNVDLAVIRRIPVRAGAVELRAEIFNVLNTPPLGAPAAIVGAANFGTITTAGDPRVAQLAFKVLF